MNTQINMWGTRQESVGFLSILPKTYTNSAFKSGGLRCISSI